MMTTWGNTYWPVFIIAVTIAFLGPEIYAIVTNAANTLSWYSWHELHVPTSGQAFRHTAAWFLSQGTYIVVAAWLIFHVWYHRFT